MKARIEECEQADKEHGKSLRQYAHVFHRDGIICVSQAFWELPERLRLAILLHEAGHLLAGQDAGEEEANRAVEERSGIPIRYQDCRWGEDLESIPSGEVQRAREFLGMD